MIVNEFGDVGIDGEILKGCGIESCTEDRIVELSNGCICCTVADDFVPALKSLLDRANPPEHIVIETSGLALPKPLVKAFNWPEIASRVTVDGVVAVVDGAAVAAGRFADDPEAIARQRAEDASLDHDNPLEEVYEDQLLCADLVVLNKADLMSAAELQAVTGEIGRTLPRAVKVVEVQNGKVSIVRAARPRRRGGSRPRQPSLASRPRGRARPRRFRHLRRRRAVVRLAAGRWSTASRKATGAHDILRVKGFVEIAGKPMRLLVQGVGARIQHQFDRPWRSGEARAGPPGGDRREGLRPGSHPRAPSRG